MANKETPHAGHRRRMRERFYQTHLQGFQKHEIIEMILYGAIPQRDVNPLAHTLIDAFGTVDGVLSASREALLEVPGVGERTADLIHCVNDLCAYYDDERLAFRQIITTVTEAAAVVHPALHGDQRELGILCQDAMGCLIAARAFPWPPKDSVGVRMAVDMALQLSAHSAILVLSRPRAMQPPGREDLEELSRLIGVFSAVEVYTVDAIMFHGEKLLSLRKEKLLRDETASSRDEDARWRRWLSPLERLAGKGGWYPWQEHTLTTAR